MHDVVGEVVVEVLMEDAMFRLLDIVLLVRVFGEGIIAKGVEEHTGVHENEGEADDEKYLCLIKVRYISDANDDDGLQTSKEN
ncbi:hypothetical protein V6N12_009315 [Hibiscus sabdariffa]|uniref:Uncharacterized protein n=1 Tax=Hibiscus sabdariffa TaxID=183260 RepID=A0ABR2E8S3_9ROSI